jgi:phosphoglycolate phosphatase
VAGLMRFKGILFDKDGTLIEADSVWVPLYRDILVRMRGVDVVGANKLLSKAGYDIENDRVIGGTVIAGGTTSQLVDLWWPEADAETRRSIVREIDVTDKQVHTAQVTPVVELVELLRSLRGYGFHVGIATNDSSSSTHRHADKLGIGALLDAVICADTVSVPKPAGNMIRAFAEQMQIRPEQIIMVGDNIHDMHEAVNGGAGYRVAVLSGNSLRDELAHHADVTLNHVGELPDHLEAIGVL